MSNPPQRGRTFPSSQVTATQTERICAELEKRGTDFSASFKAVMEEVNTPHPVPSSTFKTIGLEGIVDDEDDFLPKTPSPDCRAKKRHKKDNSTKTSPKSPYLTSISKGKDMNHKDLIAAYNNLNLKNRQLENMLKMKQNEVKYLRAKLQMIEDLAKPMPSEIINKSSEK